MQPSRFFGFLDETARRCLIYIKWKNFKE